MSTSYNNRFLLLDVMRAFAVFMMIQGHSIDALLSHKLYNSQSFIFQIWQFGRGLTAPIFLFGSGFAYVLANTRKSIEGKLPITVALKRLRWIGVLFLTGALMHFPVPSLGMIDMANQQQWSIFFHVDVLRLIAVTLLGLLGLMLISKSPNQLLVGSLIVGISIVALTPFAFKIHWMEFLPEYIAGFLSMETGSYFPIFPFSAYLFAGAVAASLYLRWKAAGEERILLRNFFITGSSMIMTALALQNVIFNGNTPESWNPVLFFLRIGSVLLLWAAVGITIKQIKTLPSIVPIVGQHTLLIYVTHIVILYGCAWFWGLKQVYGKELSLLPVIGIILLLLISMTALAYGTHRLKTQRTLAYRLVPYASMAILSMFMLIY